MSFAFAVEHFSKFWRFCSALGSARAGFWGSGRQKRGIPPFFCLLSDPREPILKGQVDKKEAFIPFFVYFRIRAGRILGVRLTKKRHSPVFLSTFGSTRAYFEGSGRQKRGLHPVFCLLSGPRAPICPLR